VSGELLAFRLNSLHNLTYYLRLAREARKAVIERSAAAFAARVESLYPDEAALLQGLKS
jgi:queuine tRNA-ribosyltransferase